MANKKINVECNSCGQFQQYLDSSEQIDRETWPKDRQCVWCSTHGTLKVISISYINMEEKK